VTSDADIAPDSIVRTALRRLPVPEHSRSFWEELDQTLALEPSRHVHEPALAVGPPLAPSASLEAATGARPAQAGTVRRPRREPDPALRLVPPSLRRRSNVLLLLLAAAAAVLVALSGAALVHNRAGTGLGTGGVVEVPAAGAADAAAPPH
jgi:hypothetical protein